MILLYQVADSANTWNIPHLQDFNQIFQIIGTIAVVIYVVYTYKTFRQLKKQTDYQQDAYLRVSYLDYPNLPQKTPLTFSSIAANIVSFPIYSGGNPYSPNSNLSENYIQTDLSRKFKEALKKIFQFDDNVYEGSFFTLDLTNYGNAEINKVKIKMVVTVSHSEVIVKEKLLQKSITEENEIIIDEIIGRNGGQIAVPLISTASFPFYKITISGSYFDIRDKVYIIPSFTVEGKNIQFHRLPEKEKPKS